MSETNNSFSLDRTQLKIIAIISMVIDHTAWGFVDFYSPLGQVMHVMGRLTIPIMCFFIAEGFRRTHDLKRYILRMAAYAAITVIPFYIFFGEEYGYRQNIIFDYLLGLLMLTTLEHKSLLKWQKVLIVTLLFVVSITVGGWIITPECFILAFYYGRDFKEKSKWVILSTVTTVAFLVVAILLNEVYHFSHYEWLWWDKFYLMGFILGLPLLKYYNGQKGKDILGKNFFYIFYPAHFLVLAIIKAFVTGKASSYGVYLTMHVFVLLAIMFMLVGVLSARPTRGQNAIGFFLMTAAIYVIGFIVEIISTTAQGYYLACIVQYAGEFMMLIAVLFVVSECSLIRLPAFVYAIHADISVILMYLLITTRETGFFYSSIGVNMYHLMLRPELVHSTGFYLTMGYFAIVCLEVIGICIYTMRYGADIEKKRAGFVLWAMFFCWLPYGLTMTGLTAGFEIPALGLAIAGVFLYKCFFSYGALDSVALASVNALDKAHEGILVLDERYHIAFHNRIIDEVIGDIPHNVDVRKNDKMQAILTGKITRIELNERVYEINVENLVKSGYSQGYMIWLLDITEHIANLRTISEMANRDVLTGLYNRGHFKELVDEDVNAGRMGCFLMMDMDNFKQINDRYGHQRGDTVLKSLADILSAYSDEDVYACRVGGDEFCAYLRKTTDPEVITDVIDNIMKSFAKTFRADDEVKCTVSIGAVINDNPELLLDCSTMYSVADGRLYEAKEAGKNTYRI